MIVLNTLLNELKKPALIKKLFDHRIDEIYEENNQNSDNSNNQDILKLQKYHSAIKNGLNIP